MLALVSAPAFALATPSVHAHAHAMEATTSVANEDAAIPGNHSVEQRAALEAKMKNQKLKLCQNRQKVITRVMGRISDRGQKQLNLFSSIATKTENFYTKKGKTLSNYDVLVTDVNTKKQAAQMAVDDVKAKSQTFTCDGADPKGMVTTFRQSLKNETAALKEYKTAVKNLIVGVKSVQGTTSSTSKTSGENQ